MAACRVGLERSCGTLSPCGRFLQGNIDNEIYPTLGDKLLKEITALDVQAIVYRKRDNGRIASAMQLRGVMKQMFDYALEVDCR